MNRTQLFTRGRPLREQEIAFRFLAREPRTRRRMLAASLHEVLERSISSDGMLEARVVQPTTTEFPHYIFLFLKRKDSLNDEEYREVRKNLLANYCLVTKLKFPRATNIVGIATEAGLPSERSEDLIYLDASRWSPTDEAKAKQIQNEFGLLRKVSSGMSRECEYPVTHTGKPRTTVPSRNSPCPCGSRKRFKRCHGKSVFGKEL